MHTQPDKAEWFLTPRFRKTATLVIAVVFVVLAFDSVVNRHNDFRWHYWAGEAVRGGHIYHFHHESADPVGMHYLVGRHLYDVLLTLPPYRVSRAIFFTLGVSAFAGSVVLWRRMMRAADPRPRDHVFAAVSLSLLAMAVILARDMHDCALQMTMLFMLTAGGYAIMKRRPIVAGFWLGLAVTYKTIPVLVLPLLLYKRRWREALCMAAFIAVFNGLVPWVILGGDETIRVTRTFLASAHEAISMEDPSANPVEPAKQQNVNLKMSIARFVQTYPSDHPLHVPHPDDRPEGLYAINPDARPHPWYINFADLSHRDASRVVMGVMGALVLVLAWRYRKPWTGDGGTPEQAWRLTGEWAALLLLLALASPLCWTQHLVFAWPAMYVVMHTKVGRAQPRWRRWALTAIVFVILVPWRDIVGKANYPALASYKLVLFAMLALLLLVLTLRRDRLDASAPNKTNPIENNKA